MWLAVRVDFACSRRLGDQVVWSKSWDFRGCRGRSWRTAAGGDGGRHCTASVTHLASSLPRWWVCWGLCGLGGRNCARWTCLLPYRKCREVRLKASAPPHAGDRARPRHKRYHLTRVLRSSQDLSATVLECMHGFLLRKGIRLRERRISRLYSITKQAQFPLSSV